MRSLFIAFVISIFTTVSAHADDTEDIYAVVDEYLEAYLAFDLDRVERLVSEDYDFSDPTSDSLPNPFNHTGRDNIMALWREYRSGVDAHQFVYEIENRFTYSGHVVLIGRGGWRVEDDGNLHQAMMPFVTIITVRDGQVVAHRDYADYATGFAGLTVTPIEGDD